MLRQELYKLFEKKLLIILLGLCVLNIMQIYYLESKTNSYSSDRSYKVLWAQVKSIVINSGYQAAYETISKENIQKKQLQGFYNAYRFNYLEESNYDKDFLENAYKSIERNPNITYQEIRKECELYQQVFNELESFVGYKDYLYSIDENAKQLNTISIFQLKDSYANRLIKKTPAAYQKMKSIELRAEPSMGVELFSKSIVTDIIAIFLLIYCSLIIWTREKENGMKHLLFTCYKGRKRLIFTKLVTMSIACLTILVVLYSGNLLVAERLYGIGDLSRYLPSVLGFSQTTWRITVYEYFILFLAVKYLTYLSLTFIIIAIADFCNNVVFTFCGIMALETLGVITYTSIPSSSGFSLLKYILPYGMLRTDAFFQTYINVNLFGYPYDITYCVGAFILIELITLPILIRFLYTRRRKNERGIAHHVEGRISSLSRVFAGKYTGLFKHELYKAFITQRVLLIILLIIIFQFIIYKPKDELLGSIDDIYFKQYMLKLSGPLTVDKEQYILDQKVYFEELYELSRKMMSAGRGNSILQDEMKPYQAFQRVVERYEYLRNTEGAYFVYDIPFNELTAGYNNHNDSRLALTYLLLLIFCVSGIFGMDYQIQTERISSMTLKGRKQLAWVKIGIIVIVTAMLMVIVYLPFILQIWMSYGIDDTTLRYPVNSVPNLAHLGARISIGIYLLLTYVFRFVFGIIIGITASLIARKIRNVIGTILLSALIFCMPTAFIMVSEKFIVWYYPLSWSLGNLPCTYSILKFLILFVGLLIISLIMLYWLIDRHQAKG